MFPNSSRPDRSNTNRVLLIAAFLFSLCVPASSQFNGCPAGFCSPISTASATYQGPGDIIANNWVFWGSCGRVFKASLASTTTNLCDLYASGSTSTLVGTLRGSSTGKVDLSAYFTGSVTPSAACSAATGGSCVVGQIYDQSGAGNPATQSTGADKPPITFSVQNGLPCLTSATASTAFSLLTPNLTQSLPFFFIAVAERTGATTTVQAIMQNKTGTTITLQYRGATNSIATNAGGSQIQSSSGTPDNSFLALIGNLDIAGNADSILVSNGISVAGPAATGTGGFSANPLAIFGNGPASGGASIDGNGCEFGFNGSFLNSTQYGNLTTNMRSSSNGWNF